MKNKRFILLSFLWAFLPTLLWAEVCFKSVSSKSQFRTGDRVLLVGADGEGYHLLNVEPPFLDSKDVPHSVALTGASLHENTDGSLIATVTDDGWQWDMQSITHPTTGLSNYVCFVNVATHDTLAAVSNGKEKYSLALSSSKVVDRLWQMKDMGQGIFQLRHTYEDGTKRLLTHATDGSSSSFVMEEEQGDVRLYILKEEDETPRIVTVNGVHCLKGVTNQQQMDALRLDTLQDVTQLDVRRCEAWTTPLRITLPHPNVLLLTDTQHPLQNTVNVVVDGVCAQLLVLQGYDFGCTEGLTAKQAWFRVRVIPDGEYQTLFVPFALPLVEGVECSVFSHLTNDGVMFKHSRHDSVPALTPCLLRYVGNTAALTDAERKDGILMEFPMGKLTLQPIQQTEYAFGTKDGLCLTGTLVTHTLNTDVGGVYLLGDDGKCFLRTGAGAVWPAFKLAVKPLNTRHAQETIKLLNHE